MRMPIAIQAAASSSLDADRLSGRQKFLIGVSAFAQMIDFLDFFLISFVLTFIVKPWHLSVVQTTAILLSAGVGASLGSIVCGALADRIGRRPMFLASIFLFTACTGLLGLIPDGAWVLLTALRFFVGFGATGMYSVNIPLLQEYMPASKRGFASGLVATFIPVGVMLGSMIVATLGTTVGWRGLFGIGFGLGVILLGVGWIVPESPLWLASRGLAERARRSFAWATGRAEVAFALQDLPAMAKRPDVRFMELFQYPRKLIVSCAGVLGAQVAYYGLTLWAPVLLVVVLKTTPSHAAFLLLFCNLADVLARLTFARMSDRVGRRLIGILQGFAGSALLVLASLSTDRFIGEISVFWIMLMATYFFVSGGFAVTVPYVGEIWPLRLRASGLGSAYGVGSLGKVIGPLGLGMMLGSSNVLSPAATADAIVPAFCYLAAWGLLTGLVFLFLAEETRGIDLSN
ncbi:Putative niacin/nicotinamide transporter NaiP [Paraburkholderia aspalathi]|uniref:MFS transporter n=1 Tax=Paraburkholderia aspalathi TaxID=1324617 RepID=UPI00190CE2B8|nr:MFS transporter [Paraburkholderia aspalathi]MBK3843820.1 MFS transporter [Paraburkholderia aspalathi]CAE6861628.1 Putative niacin/nicotinamide transporter NaiP [Paraburkholderia aspalathi]CAE6869323.1 Putative niacin/nicotinamide transporter NaiP [Paraburkholderia aspalathi]